MSEQIRSRTAVVGKKIARAVVCCAAIAACGNALAADARDYIPLPDRTLLFVTYAKHITGNKLYSNGNQASSDFNLNQNLGIFRPVYYTKLSNSALYGDGGLMLDPQMLFVFGEGHIDGAALNQNSVQASGIADPVFLATLWFVNAPKEQFWIGFTPYLTVPIGQYSSTRSLNLGNNRWAVKPESGVVKGFGNFNVDVNLNVEFYTPNDNAFNAAQQTQVRLTQNPLFGVETHLSYDLNKNWFVAADYFFAGGGETKFDGIANDNSQQTHSVGASFFWLLGTSNQLMLQYRQDVSVRNGPSTNNFGARWAHFF